MLYQGGAYLYYSRVLNMISDNLYVQWVKFDSICTCNLIEQDFAGSKSRVPKTNQEYSEFDTLQSKGTLQYTSKTMTLC